MRAAIALILASGLLAGCAGDPCRAPTEREMRQGIVRGVAASCIPSAPAAATKESKQ